MKLGHKVILRRTELCLQSGKYRIVYGDAEVLADFNTGTLRYKWRVFNTSEKPVPPTEGYADTVLAAKDSADACLRRLGVYLL